MIYDDFPALIVVLPLFAAFTVPIIGYLSKKSVPYFVSFATFIAFLISIFNLQTVMSSGTISYTMGGWEPPWGIEYRIDYLNAFVSIVVIFIIFIVSIYSRKSIENELPGKTVPFFTIFLLLTAGLQGLIVTGDIFNVYVFLEISSLAAYALIAVGSNRNALMASLNYLIIGTVSASFILLGIGYLYMVTGTLNMADMANILPAAFDERPKVVLAAFAFFLVGFSIKVGLFPLHTWMPDAYSQAPSAVSALLASTFTKVAAYVMVRFMITIFKPEFIISTVNANIILAWLAAIAIIAGSVLAISQTDFKRMLAYSSVSQIGYIILGIALLNEMSMTGGIIHIMNHGIMKAALFMVAGAIIYKTGIRNINDFKGLSKKMPYTSAAFTLVALSMIGVPPTVGFVSKWYLALGAIEADMWVFVGVIMLSSLLNIVYFWRVFENMYLYRAEGGKVDEVPLSMLLPILILAALTFLLGLLALYPLKEIMAPMVQILLPG
ncbi:MAG TPA: monovalent cation/H+ antiporter subunit D family protein [Candidatus Nanoarchaeia archaeon]|nr:monovalent cation/H+ antiporter subunit D family protein [Candidatus Nanoarchaeia archaeon]